MIHFNCIPIILYFPLYNITIFISFLYIIFPNMFLLLYLSYINFPFIYNISFFYIGRGWDVVVMLGMEVLRGFYLYCGLFILITYSMLYIIFLLYFPFLYIIFSFFILEGDGMVLLCGMEVLRGFLFGYR